MAFLEVGFDIFHINHCSWLELTICCGVYMCIVIWIQFHCFGLLIFFHGNIVDLETNHTLMNFGQPDYPASESINQVTPQDRLWCYAFRWCWSIRMQLCVLPLPSVCRATQHQITFCACATLHDNWWGGPDAFCWFPSWTPCLHKLGRTI